MKFLRVKADDADGIKRRQRELLVLVVRSPCDLLSNNFYLFDDKNSLILSTASGC